MAKTHLYIALLFLLTRTEVFSQPCTKVTDAFALFKAKDFKKAHKMIEEAELDAACRNDPATWYYKAFILQDYYRTKESENRNSPARKQAIEAAKKGLALDPNGKMAGECKKILSSLSVSYYNDAAKDLKEENFADAHANYVRHIETARLGSMGRGDSSALFYAGYTAYKTSDYEKAKDFLIQASELNYKDPNVYYYLAKCYWVKGEKEKSYKTLETGHKLFPDNKDLVVALVNSYMEDGKLKSLEASLEKALRLDPKNLDLQTTLAMVCEKLYETEGNNIKYFEKAEKHYKEAIRLDSNNWKANYNLGIMFYNKAVNMIDKLDPDTDIKSIYLAQEKCEMILKEALPYMLKAYKSDQNRAEICEGLAGIYLALNNKNAANLYRMRAKDLAKNNLNKK